MSLSKCQVPKWEYQRFATLAFPSLGAAKDAKDNNSSSYRICLVQPSQDNVKKDLRVDIRLWEGETATVSGVQLLMDEVSSLLPLLEAEDKASFISLPQQYNRLMTLSPDPVPVLTLIKRDTNVSSVVLQNRLTLTHFLKILGWAASLLTEEDSEDVDEQILRVLTSLTYAAQ